MLQKPGISTGSTIHCGVHELVSSVISVGVMQDTLSVIFSHYYYCFLIFILMVLDKSILMTSELPKIAEIHSITLDVTNVGHLDLNDFAYHIYIYAFNIHI